MKIVAGKYYKTRDGRRVGPMIISYDFRGDIAKNPENSISVWAESGTRIKEIMGKEDPTDLIEEWSDKVMEQSPVREVVTRELVGGDYGNLTIYRGSDNDWRIEMNTSRHTVAEIRDMIKVLTEVADYLSAN